MIRHRRTPGHQEWQPWRLDHCDNCGYELEFDLPNPDTGDTGLTHAEGWVNHWCEEPSHTPF